MKICVKLERFFLETLHMLYDKAQVGVNILDLDKAFAEFIAKNGCESNFLDYGGFQKLFVFQSMTN